MGKETAQIQDQYLQWKEAQNTRNSEYVTPQNRCEGHSVLFLILRIDMQKKKQTRPLCSITRERLMIMYINCFMRFFLFSALLSCLSLLLPHTFLFTSLVSLCDSAHKPELHQASDAHNPFKVSTLADY